MCVWRALDATEGVDKERYNSIPGFEVIKQKWWLPYQPGKSEQETR